MPSARNPSQPPSPGPRPIRILPVPSGDALVVLWLGQYQGILTHYNKSGPVYCPGPGECPPASHRQRAIWKGYAPVTWWRKDIRLWQPDVLEVTERLEEQIRGRELRGEVWSLSRRGDGSKSDPIIGEYCQTLAPDKVPPPFDTLAVVQRCYHSPGLKFGAANPLPAPIVLALVEGDAPQLPAGLAPPAPVPASPEEIAALRAKARRTFGHTSSADQGTAQGNGHNGREKLPPGR